MLKMLDFAQNTHYNKSNTGNEAQSRRCSGLFSYDREMSFFAAGRHLRGLTETGKEELS